MSVKLTVSHYQFLSSLVDLHPSCAINIAAVVSFAAMMICEARYCSLFLLRYDTTSLLPLHSHFGSSSVELASGLKSVWLLLRAKHSLLPAINTQLLIFVAHWCAAQSLRFGAALFLQTRRIRSFLLVDREKQ